MADMYTKQDLSPWLDLIETLVRSLAKLEEAIGTAWIDAEEAQQLTGRSRAWFYELRTRGTLPIALMPRTERNRKLKYSKADCVAYGIKHQILPPREVTHPIQFPSR